MCGTTSTGLLDDEDASITTRNIQTYSGQSDNVNNKCASNISQSSILADMLQPSVKPQLDLSSSSNFAYNCISVASNTSKCL